MNHPKKNHRREQRDHGGSGERRGLAEWLAVYLDIPSDITTGGLRMDLRGRHSLTVYGCREILDFTPREIRLRLSEGSVTVGGWRLICSSYLAGAVSIEGCICGITFCDGEGEA